MYVTTHIPFILTKYWTQVKLIMLNIVACHNFFISIINFV